MSIVRPSQARRAFTLIELLVVIAIIAIIAAILFPVFAKVREKARQTTVISDMHQIQTGLEAYKLDYHKYPDVLFGYADNGGSMATYTPATGAVPSLYPNYVKTYQAFTDPNNPVTDPAQATGALNVNTLDTTGNLTTATTHKFFTEDAYDVSPQVTGENAISNGSSISYVPRYQLSWSSINTSLAGNCTSATSPATCAQVGGGPIYNAYNSQLRWRSQPGTTYVTCSTYHVPNAGLVIVLFQDGPAKVVDTSKFLALGPDVTGLSAGTPNFWKIQP